MPFASLLPETEKENKAFTYQVSHEKEDWVINFPNYSKTLAERIFKLSPKYAYCWRGKKIKIKYLCLQMEKQQD